MNNIDLVNDALMLIGVLAEGMTASPEQADLAMRETDSIVEELSDDGIIVNWSPQGALSDPCSLQGIERTTVLYHLAVRLCPHFGREPAKSVMGLAGSAYNRLLRIQLVQSIAPVSLSLPQGEGDWTGIQPITGR